MSGLRTDLTPFLQERVARAASDRRRSSALPPSATLPREIPAPGLPQSDRGLASLAGNVFGCAVGQRLNGAGRLAACRHQAAAIHQKQVRHVVRAVVAITT